MTGSTTYQTNPKLGPCEKNRKVHHQFNEIMYLIGFISGYI